MSINPVANSCGINFRKPHLFGYTNGQNNFVELVTKAGKINGIDIKFPPFVIGAAADHFPFVYEGFNAVTLSTVSRKSMVIHTRKDDIERIELEGIETAERLILSIIDLINIDEYKK